MRLLALASANSALTKLDALFNALSFKQLLISILKVKCKQCINHLVNISVSYITSIGEMVKGCFDALFALFGILISIFNALLMHYLASRYQFKCTNINQAMHSSNSITLTEPLT